MNKEEKIGMYTREQILDYMQDREGSMLGRSMYDAIMNKIDRQQSQLDIANNKLKEVSKLVNYEYSKEKLEKERWSEQFISGALTLREDILSIIGGNDE